MSACKIKPTTTHLIILAGCISIFRHALTVAPWVTGTQWKSDRRIRPKVPRIVAWVAPFDTPSLRFGTQDAVSIIRPIIEMHPS